jgi:hypothetical protein
MTEAAVNDKFDPAPHDKYADRPAAAAKADEAAK